MVGQTSNYQTAAQINQGTPINGTKSAIGTTPDVVYTVPAGKKAQIIALSNEFIAYGANSFIRLQVGGLEIRRITAPTAVPETVFTIEQVTGQMLTAGQTVQYTGDNAGNNGTANFFLTYKELPA